LITPVRILEPSNEELVEESAPAKALEQPGSASRIIS
jgi:hypothetical protein